MVNKNTLTLAELGIFTAIIFVLTFTPIGMIPLGVVSATIIHIPVMIGAAVLGIRCAAILGGVMGVASLIRAAVWPNGTLDMFFINPLVSVLPRVLAGLVAGAIFMLVTKLIKNKAAVPLGAGLCAFFGTLTNTVLVLSMLCIFAPQQMGVTSFSTAVNGIIGTIIAVNGLFEIISAVVICIPATMAILKIKKSIKAS